MAAANTTCDYCGETLGNAGACANHERACPYNPENAPEARQQPQQQQAPRPARRQPQQGQPPARQQGRSAGDTLVDTAIAIADDDMPLEVRADAIRGGLGIVGDAIVRYQEYRDRKMEEQRNRAKRAELGEPQEYPQCECGHTFGPEEIGLNQSEVQCPDCTTVYEIVDRGSAEDVENVEG